MAKKLFCGGGKPKKVKTQKKLENRSKRAGKSQNTQKRPKHCETCPGRSGTSKNDQVRKVVKSGHFM